MIEDTKYCFVFHFSQGLARIEIKFKRVFTNFDKPVKKTLLLLQEVFLKNDPVLALKNKNLFIVSHVRVPFFSVNMGRDLCWRQCYHEIW